MASNSETATVQVNLRQILWTAVLGPAILLMFVAFRIARKIRRRNKNRRQEGIAVLAGDENAEIEYGLLF